MGKKQPYKLERSVSTLSTLVRVIGLVGPCYESIIKFPHGLAREKSYTPKFVTFLPFLFVTANRTFALNRNLRIRQQHLTPLLYFILLNWPHCFIWSWHYGCYLFLVRWIFLLWIITFVLESPMSFLRKYRKKVQIVNIRETEIKLKWNWRNQKKKRNRQYFNWSEQPANNVIWLEQTTSLPFTWARIWLNFYSKHILVNQSPNL